MSFPKFVLTQTQDNYTLLRLGASEPLTSGNCIICARYLAWEYPDAVLGKLFQYLEECRITRLRLIVMGSCFHERLQLECLIGVANRHQQMRVQLAINRPMETIEATRKEMGLLYGSHELQGSGCYTPLGNVSFVAATTDDFGS